MKKHTAGPWEVRNSGSHGYDILTGIIQAEGKPTMGDFINVNTHINSEANAHLISAAPENLEAHESLLEGLKALKLFDSVPDLKERIAASEAAIKKAKGE